MSSILALSANHLAWITRNQDTQQLAYHHRGVAMKGLQKAMSTFANENFEAILAASTLLSWQATEWYAHRLIIYGSANLNRHNWASLQHGLTTILNSIPPVWKQESELARYLEDERSMGYPKSSLMAGFQVQDEDLANLDHTILALQGVQKRVSHNQEYYSRIGELLDFVQHFRKVLPTQSLKQAFESVQPLRRWLFWLPPAMLRGGGADINALAIIAQFYGVAVALDSLFPDMGGAYLGPLSIAPIEDIYRLILSRNTTDPFNPGLQLSLSIMDLPRHIANRYRNRLHWSPRPSMDHYSPAPPSPYSGIHDYRVSSSSPSSTSATYAPYTPPLQSPPAVAIATSPLEVSGPGTQALYPPSPRLYSQRDDLPALTHSTSIPTPAFSSAYVDDAVCSLPPMETAIGLSLGFYNDPPAVQPGGLVPTEPCWT